MCPRNQANIIANIADTLHVLLALEEVDFDFERVPPANLKTRDDEVKLAFFRPKNCDFCLNLCKQAKNRGKHDLIFYNGVCRIKSG